MRSRARLPYAALACLLALAGCRGADAPAEAPARPVAAAAGTVIPDDFPLAAGMGAAGDAVPTARTGTGLRGLELCGETPLRGLTVRDRMVADNSGGEAADTRELVLLGSADEAAEVARTMRTLVEECDRPTLSDSDARTRTDVLGSPFGPAPAVALQQTWTFDGRPADGSVLVHVVPEGAALLVASTYGAWTREEADRAVAETSDALRDTVTALARLEGGGTS